jgi:hypothetical protein
VSNDTAEDRAVDPAAALATPDDREAVPRAVTGPGGPLLIVGGDDLVCVDDTCLPADVVR